MTTKQPLNSMDASVTFHKQYPCRNPVDEAMVYLRNTIARQPTFGCLPSLWEVLNIEGVGNGTLCLDLSDGTTIRLDVQRYPTDTDTEDLGRN
jgi:hypothetical protein